MLARIMGLMGRHPANAEPPPVVAVAKPIGSPGASKSLTETIEFFTPRLGLDVSAYIEAEQKQGIHHVGRYQWAVPVLAKRKPSRIVDLACGAGYGSYMLAQAMPESEVIGVDYDSRAVEYAKDNYKAPNLSYSVGNVVTWQSEDNPLPVCDAITSFDTIEHLLHRELALMRMADNLTDNGCLLLSTPCGHDVSKLNPGWEHHKLEFSHTDLYSFVSRFFERVIAPDDPRYENLEFWKGVVNRDKQRYLNKMNPLICEAPIRIKQRNGGEI